MNVHLEDPLSELLLDNNDYKANSKGKNKKVAGSPDDLFGIKTGIKVLSRDQNVQKMNRETETGDDNFDNVDLGFDPKRPKAGTGYIFDDILGETPRPSTAKPSLSQQFIAYSDIPNPTHAQLRPKTSTDRRNAGYSPAMNLGPLGAKKRAASADWLGLGEASEQKEETHTKVLAEPELPKNLETDTPRENIEYKTQPNALEVPAEMGAQKLSNFQIPEGGILPSVPISAPAQNVMLLNAINSEAQNACNVLQQQELQLTLATQMKQREQALMEMQRKQESVLRQQEYQFNTLLQQQVHRQQQLEDYIKSQQQRITNHIQLLLTQPALAPLPQIAVGIEDTGAETSTAEVCDRKTPQKLGGLEMAHLETDVKRLELEKLRLEELVENLKLNYEKEIDMVKQSLKKQLEVLEDQMNSMEIRLKTEIEELHSFYRKKVEALAEDKQKLKLDYETQVTALKQDHDDEVRKLRKSQEDDIDMLREEHRRMLDTIRQAKALEFSAVQENGSYLETLKAASTNLANVSGGLEMLRDEMQSKIETINREREHTLEIREKRLENSEKRLQVTQASAEEEKRHLMELVSTLEVQLDRKTKESEDENWLLRQQMATLEAERASFAREKLLLREQFARDEERIADLKEQQLAETQRQRLELESEKSRLDLERTKFETERRLQQPTDLEKQRMEVEAALEVAKNASAQADAERLRYHRLQRSLMQTRRDLVEKENCLHAKEEEVEQELQAMRRAEQKSLETQHRAHVAERSFQAKIKFLRQRMRELVEKESQLSQEQLLLAQERIKFHKAKELGVQKCVLCQINNRNAEVAQTLYTEDADMKRCGVASGNTNAGAQRDEMGDRTNEEVGIAVGADGYQGIMNGGNVVDRILDDNIAASYRRMRQSMLNTDYYSESALDDDSKEFVLNNLDVAFHLRNTDGPYE